MIPGDGTRDSIKTPNWGVCAPRIQKRGHSWVDLGRFFLILLLSLKQALSWQVIFFRNVSRYLKFGHRWSHAVASRDLCTVLASLRLFKNNNQLFFKRDFVYIVLYSQSMLKCCWKSHFDSWWRMVLQTQHQVDYFRGHPYMARRLAHWRWSWPSSSLVNHKHS